MINLEDELAQDYLGECREHLVSLEVDLVAIEKAGMKVDVELVDRASQTLHRLKTGAGRFDLSHVSELAHHTEGVLALIRSNQLDPKPNHVRVLLGAVDKLRALIENPGTSNQTDIAPMLAALASLAGEPRSGVSIAGPFSSGRSREAAKQLRVLLVEDDFASRLLLQTFLSRYGECHVAVNGSEAVQAFRFALEHGERYGLICMDIMMPEMDGREAVRQIRALEEEHGILSTKGAKIIMTTAVDDVKEVVRCFHELCDSYLTKPVDLGQLLEHMKTFQMV